MELVERTRRWAHPHHSTGASTSGTLAGSAGAGNGAVAATSRFVWDGGMSVSVPAPRGGTIGWQWSPGWKPGRSTCGSCRCPARNPLDTSTATGRLVLAVIGAVEQAEREATFAQRVRHNRHVRAAVLGRKWLAYGSAGLLLDWAQKPRRWHWHMNSKKGSRGWASDLLFLEPNVTRAMPITNLARIKSARPSEEREIITRRGLIAQRAIWLPRMPT
jgi:hypothetical protein